MSRTESGRRPPVEEIVDTFRRSRMFRSLSTSSFSNSRYGGLSSDSSGDSEPHTGEENRRNPFNSASWGSGSTGPNLDPKLYGLDERQVLIVVLLAQICGQADPTPKTFVLSILRFYEMGLLDSVGFLHDLGLLPQNLLPAPTSVPNAGVSRTFAEGSQRQSFLSRAGIGSLLQSIAAGDVTNDSQGARMRDIYGNLAGRTSPLDHIEALNMSRYRREFEELERIGRGGFGQVHRAQHRVDGRFYAVKKITINSKGYNNPLVKRILREVKCLAALDHPNVNRYFSAWLEPTWVPAPMFVVQRMKLDAAPSLSEAATDVQEESNLHVPANRRNLVPRRMMTMNSLFPRGRHRMGTPLLLEDVEKVQERSGFKENGPHASEESQSRDSADSKSPRSRSNSLWHLDDGTVPPSYASPIKRDWAELSEEKSPRIRRSVSAPFTHSTVESSFRPGDSHRPGSAKEGSRPFAIKEQPQDGAESLAAPWSPSESGEREPAETSSKHFVHYTDSSASSDDSSSSFGDFGDAAEVSDWGISSAAGMPWGAGSAESVGGSSSPYIPYTFEDPTPMRTLLLEDRVKQSRRQARRGTVAEPPASEGDNDLGRPRAKTDSDSREAEEDSAFPPTTFQYKITLHIQMALYGRQTLEDMLEVRNTSGCLEIDEQLNLKLFKQLVKGLAHIHEMQIIHRDIKPSNIFIGLNGQLKIGDFGLSKLVEEAEQDESDVSPCVDGSSGACPSVFEGEHVLSVEDDAHTTGVGTSSYMSPEQLGSLPALDGEEEDEEAGAEGPRKGPRSGSRCQRYGPASDIFSLGLILLELFSIFPTRMEKADAFRAVRADPPSLPLELQRRYPSVAALITAMVHRDARQRPSAATILTSPIFRSREVEVERLRYELEQKNRIIEDQAETIRQLRAALAEEQAKSK